MTAERLSRGANGFPKGITSVPAVRLDAIELGGEDLADKLHQVLDAASPSSSE